MKTVYFQESKPVNRKLKITTDITVTLFKYNYFVLSAILLEAGKRYGS